MGRLNQGLGSLLSLAGLLLACGRPQPAVVSRAPVVEPQVAAPATPVEKAMEPQAPHQDDELVSLETLDPSIRVELRLATSDHPFGGAILYRSNTAFLRYGTAKKLVAVQRELQEKGLGLKIWDAYRPFTVQVALFNAVGGNPGWVSDPYRSTGKKTHVRGVAIDCTIVDASGNELAMPTPYLDFEAGAEKMKHGYLNLSREVLANRRLLKETMAAHGMESYVGEWWHYQDKDWGRYPIIRTEDFPEVHQQLLVDRLLPSGESLPPSP